MKRLFLSSLFVALAAASFVSPMGCVDGKPIGEGQACPCAPGWVCDTLINVCHHGAAGTGGAGTGVAGTGGPGSGAAGTFFDDGQDHTPPVAPGCGATCGTPAGTVQTPASIDDLYTIIQGRWQFCSGAWQTAVNAPADAIGVEFGPGSRALQPDSTNWTVGGKMYYLVAGPSGPERGRGFAYQLAYGVSEDPFQINVYPTPNSFWIGSAIRYSTCPVEVDLRLLYETTTTTLVRFMPGDGIQGGSVDASSSLPDAGAPPTDAVASPTDAVALPTDAVALPTDAPRLPDAQI